MKIALVDYIGYENHEGVPVGHPLKVVAETIELLEKDPKIEVETVATQAYLAKLPVRSGIELPLAVNAVKSGKNAWENLKCMLISFININHALKHLTADVVWFCNVDQFLFMYLGMFGFHNKKIIVTLFAEHYHKWYHDHYLAKVLPKLSLIVNTNPDAKRDGLASISMPDYLYDPKRYAPYRKADKQEKVVCVGTMNRSKRIKELVEIWNEIPYPLEISGLFYEEDYYQEIREIKKEHIRIENRYLEYEDYLSILGSAKFSVLPYDQNAYKQFTSGVILESAFVGTVPITCEMLMQRMKLQGISYVEMEQLKNVDFGQVNAKELAAQNDAYINAELDEETCQRALFEKLMKIGALE